MGQDDTTNQTQMPTPTATTMPQAAQTPGIAAGAAPETAAQMPVSQTPAAPAVDSTQSAMPQAAQTPAMDTVPAAPAVETTIPAPSVDTTSAPAATTPDTQAS